jgi:hypothetical protein
VRTARNSAKRAGDLLVAAGVIHQTRVELLRFTVDLHPQMATAVELALKKLKKRPVSNGWCSMIRVKGVQF